MINLLATCREQDIAGSDMLARVSQNPEFNVYVAVSSDEERAMVGGRCTPLAVPPITSKFQWGVIKALRGHIRRYHIDLVFSPGSSGLSNALFASLGTKAKNIAYRGTQAKVRRTDPTYYLGVLNPRVVHLVCETDDIRDYLSRFIAPRKLSVNVKPFDVHWVDEACRAPKQIEGLPADAKTCIYVGSCKGRPFKGLSYLVDAMHRLDDARVHLIFIGDYDEADWERAQSGPAAGRIHFLGRLPREELLHYLPLQDVFVLPSSRDASPRVVREAMACGVPCAVSDIPGARDLVVDGVTGLLFPPRDPEALAAVLHRLMQDDALRKQMGKASRERIIRDYGMEAYARKFEQLFLAVARKR